MHIPEYTILATADLRIEAYGTTMLELFKNALKGMFNAAKPQGPHISYQTSNGTAQAVCTQFSEKSLVLHSEDYASLLKKFLTHCLDESKMHHEAFFDVRFLLLESHELQAIIYGCEVSEYENSKINGILVLELFKEEIDGCYRAKITFD